jgi:hypothetical protein
LGAAGVNKDSQRHWLIPAGGEDKEKNQATEKLLSEGDQILAVYREKPRLRYLIDRGGRGELSNEADGVRWRLELEAKESHDLYFSIPSITLETPSEIDGLRTTFGPGHS